MVANGENQSNMEATHTSTTTVKVPDTSTTTTLSNLLLINKMVANDENQSNTEATHTNATTVTVPDTSTTTTLSNLFLGDQYGTEATHTSPTTVTVPNTSTITTLTTTPEPTTTIKPCEFRPPNIISNETEKTKIHFNISFSDFLNEREECRPQQLQITCESSSDLTWVVVYKNVTFDLVAFIDLDYLNVTIDNLSEFTNYTCTLAYLLNQTLSAPTEIEVQTQKEVPNIPQDVKVLNITSRTLTISWKEPSKIPCILEGYSLTIIRTSVAHEDHIWQECDNNSIRQFNTTNLSMTFEEASPDFNYMIILRAISDVGLGTKFEKNVITPAEASDQPQNLEIITEDIDLEQEKYLNIIRNITWNIPCNTQGPVKSFIIQMEGNYSLDSNITDSKSRELNITANQSIYSIKFENLMAYSEYKVEIYIKGTVFNSSAISGNFNTSANYPNSPDVQTIVKSTNFFLEWNPPTNNPGPIMKYTINVKALGLNWTKYNHNSCNIDPGYYENETSLAGDIFSYMYDPANPYSYYSIDVVAHTEQGEGNFSETTLTTNMARPDSFTINQIIPTHPSGEIYDVHAMVHFEPGCFNGKFSKYEVLLKGQRQGYDDHEPALITITDINNTNVIFKLEPEYNYTVKVEVHNLDSFTQAEMDFKSLAGVPPLIIPKDIHGITQTEAKIKLNRTTFNEYSGNITYLAIIVSEQNVSQGNFFLWENTTNWPVPKFNLGIYYQATSKFWNPFAESDVIEFSIGTNTTCTDEIQFCNKPLEPGKEYFIIIRIFNKNYYRDSKSAVFITKAASKLGLILGLIFGLLAVSILGFSGVMLWRRGAFKAFRVVHKSKGYSSNHSQEDNDNLTALLLNKMVPFKRPLVEDEEPQGWTRETSLKKFVEYCTYLEQNPTFLVQEWKSLQEESEEIYNNLQTHFATLPENKRKNRYTNILPWDNSRVKLNIDEDDEICSDYINASFIKGFSNKTEYIATQGPLPGTCRDFWKMIIQENVTIIVMVSKFVENNKDKCYKYFPNNHETMTVGDDIEVRCSTELHFGLYCVRTLQVKKDMVQVSVTHMQFLEWPDFDVPSGTENMLLFCHQLRQRWKYEEGLAVVHCSAGVGRTGTLIATDILLQIIKTGKNINIYEIVLELRRQRKSMVQAQKQYMYIHQLIKSILEDPIIDEDYNEEHTYENVTLDQNNKPESILNKNKARVAESKF